jgi:hypothetical protein
MLLLVIEIHLLRFNEHFNRIKTFGKTAIFALGIILNRMLLMSKIGRIFSVEAPKLKLKKSLQSLKLEQQFPLWKILEIGC